MMAMPTRTLCLLLGMIPHAAAAAPTAPQAPRTTAESTSFKLPDATREEDDALQQLVAAVNGSRPPADRADIIAGTRAFLNDPDVLTSISANGPLRAVRRDLIALLETLARLPDQRPYGIPYPKWLKTVALSPALTMAMNAARATPAQRAIIGALTAALSSGPTYFPGYCDALQALLSVPNAGPSMADANWIRTQISALLTDEVLAPARTVYETDLNQPKRDAARPYLRPFQQLGLLARVLAELEGPAGLGWAFEAVAKRMLRSDGSIDPLVHPAYVGLMPIARTGVPHDRRRSIIDDLPTPEGCETIVLPKHELSDLIRQAGGQPSAVTVLANDERRLALDLGNGTALYIKALGEGERTADLNGENWVYQALQRARTTDPGGPYSDATLPKPLVMNQALADQGIFVLSLQPDRTSARSQDARGKPQGAAIAYTVPTACLLEYGLPSSRSPYSVDRALTHAAAIGDLAQWGIHYRDVLPLYHLTANGARYDHMAVPPGRLEDVRRDTAHPNVRSARTLLDLSPAHFDRLASSRGAPPDLADVVGWSYAPIFQLGVLLAERTCESQDGAEQVARFMRQGMETVLRHALSDGHALSDTTAMPLAMIDYDRRAATVHAKIRHIGAEGTALPIRDLIDVLSLQGIHMLASLTSSRPQSSTRGGVRPRQPR